MKLYDSAVSGHAHRARAMLNLLDVPYGSVEVDLGAGQQRTAEFVALNPMGQVPVLVDDDVVLRESTAILTYLALRYDTTRRWLPESPRLAADVQSWLAISTRELYAGPCVARLVKLFDAPHDYDRALAVTHDVLGKMFEPRLRDGDWLVGEAPTIADVSCYGYIAATHEAAIELEAYPATRAWLQRLESLPRFVRMPRARQSPTD